MSTSRNSKKSNPPSRIDQVEVSEQPIAYSKVGSITEISTKGSFLSALLTILRIFYLDLR